MHSICNSYVRQTFFFQYPSDIVANKKNVSDKIRSQQSQENKIKMKKIIIKIEHNPELKKNLPRIFSV